MALQAHERVRDPRAPDRSLVVRDPRPTSPRLYPSSLTACGRPAAFPTAVAAPRRPRVGWIRRSILLHGKRHPAEMGAPEVTGFLSSLLPHVLNRGSAGVTSPADRVLDS